LVGGEAEVALVNFGDFAQALFLRAAHATALYKEGEVALPSVPSTQP